MVLLLSILLLSGTLPFVQKPAEEINKMHQDVYDQALKHNDFEVYK